MGNVFRLTMIISFLGFTSCTNYQGQERDTGTLDQESVLFAKFLHTGAGNSLQEKSDLFEVVEIDQKMALMTDSTETNIHSHFLGEAQLTNIDYSGSLMVTDADAGIGITFLSQYPNQDTYYRLRRYSRKRDLHFEHHGGRSACRFDSTGINPQPNTWYNFRVQTDVSSTSTVFRVKVWQEGLPESDASVVECEDTSGQRIQAGTVGVWAMGPGEKYWANLKLSLDLFGDDEVTRAPASSGPVANTPDDEQPNDQEETPVVVNPTPAPTEEPAPAEPAPPAVTDGSRPGENNTGLNSTDCPRVNQGLTKSSGLKITSSDNGKTFSYLSIAGTVSIAANVKNVTLKCSKIQTGSHHAIRIDNSSNAPNNIRLENLEISGMQSSAVLGSGFSLIKSEIYDSGSDGVKPYRNALIEGNWFHHLGYKPDSHADAIQMVSGNNVTIRGNFIDNRNRGSYKSACTAMIQTNNGPIDNILIEGNFIHGSGHFGMQINNKYLTYSSSARSGRTNYGGPTNVRIKNNTFSGDIPYGEIRVLGIGAGFVRSGNIGVNGQPID